MKIDDVSSVSSKLCDKCEDIFERLCRLGSYTTFDNGLILDRGVVAGLSREEKESCTTSHFNCVTVVATFGNLTGRTVMVFHFATLSY